MSEAVSANCWVGKEKKKRLRESGKKIVDDVVGMRAERKKNRENFFSHLADLVRDRVRRDRRVRRDHSDGLLPVLMVAASVGGARMAAAAACSSSSSSSSSPSIVDVVVAACESVSGIAAVAAAPRRAAVPFFSSLRSCSATAAAARASSASLLGHVERGEEEEEMKKKKRGSFFFFRLGLRESERAREWPDLRHFERKKLEKNSIDCIFSLSLSPSKKPCTPSPSRTSRRWGPGAPARRWRSRPRRRTP
jgi:hypothetical protein